MSGVVATAGAALASTAAASDRGEEPSTTAAAPGAEDAAAAVSEDQQQQEQQQLSDAVLASLQAVVPKADVYLIKAAQASTCVVCGWVQAAPLMPTDLQSGLPPCADSPLYCTDHWLHALAHDHHPRPHRLKQLKAARKQLRDFNAAARHELDVQLAGGAAAVAQLLAIRADLDAAFGALRCVCMDACVVVATPAGERLRIGKR